VFFSNRDEQSVLPLKQCQKRNGLGAILRCESVELDVIPSRPLPRGATVTAIKGSPGSSDHPVHGNLFVPGPSALGRRNGRNYMSCHVKDNKSGLRDRDMKSAMAY
jgi:hypothetical protein